MLHRVEVNNYCRFQVLAERRRALCGCGQVLASLLRVRPPGSAAEGTEQPTVPAEREPGRSGPTPQSLRPPRASLRAEEEAMGVLKKSCLPLQSRWRFRSLIFPA